MLLVSFSFTEEERVSTISPKIWWVVLWRWGRILRCSSRSLFPSTIRTRLPGALLRLVGEALARLESNGGEDANGGNTLKALEFQ